MTKEEVIEVYNGLINTKIREAFEFFVPELKKQGEQKAKYHDVCDKCTRQPTCQSDCFLQQDEQKPAWSEEDEDMCYKAIAVINRLCAEGKDYVWSIKTLRKLFYWLKSLKERYTWKPSKEQMETLEYYMHTLICNKRKEILFGLYTDLKKLREEQV